MHSGIHNSPGHLFCPGPRALDSRSVKKFLFRNGIMLLLWPLASLRENVHDWCGLRPGWLWTMVGGTKTIATPEVLKKTILAQCATE